MPPPAPDRRIVLAAAAAALAPPWLTPARGQPGAALTLRASAIALQLRPPAPTPATRLVVDHNAPPTLRQGETIAFVNDLPVAVRLHWRGMAGPPVTSVPVPSGGTSVTAPIRDSGTLLCVADPVADLPPAAQAIIVTEAEPVAADRDEVMLIEEWRLDADHRAVSPRRAADAASIFTTNRAERVTVAAPPHSRIRFRFVNGSQRSVVAIRIPDHDVHVWAIDSRPAEPFLARNNQVVLPPGGRIDALVDVSRQPGGPTPILLHDGSRAHIIGQLVCTDGTARRPSPLGLPAPLPAGALPATLALARATRIALDLATDLSPSPATAPAFRLKRGQVAVLALKNNATEPVVVALCGQSVRLLDRLDDGWKPFWLDTLLVPPGATKLVAFKAEHPGRFPIEAVAPVWGAAPRTGIYTVE